MAVIENDLLFYLSSGNNFLLQNIGFVVNIGYKCHLFLDNCFVIESHYRNGKKSLKVLITILFDS